MRLRFITSRLCPFAQRNLIVLEAKAIDFEVIPVDLFDKPSWLFDLNPTGKVPLLEVDGEVLAESNVINEFLEEMFLERHLHPETALRRARHRMWIEAVSPLNMEVHRIMMSPDEATAVEATGAVRQRLTTLEGQIAGPLFTGPALSLIDVAAAPAMVRLAWCAAIAPSTNAVAGLAASERWQRALVEDEAVQRTTSGGLHALWLQFIQGGGSPKRSAPPSWLGTLSRAQAGDGGIP